MIEISPEEARSLVLDIQGLRTKNPNSSLMDVANRIHNIQIDTISVVSRSHNLIAFNRCPNYNEGDVWSLQKQGKLFEYWSHAMCLMPMKSYPYYAWKMTRMQENRTSWYTEWAFKNQDIVEDVYQMVKKNGVTRSKDMGDSQEKSDGWWDWKKEKRALEALSTLGRLMVSYREGFQKYYDLPERVIPPGIDTAPMLESEVPFYLVNTTFRSLGIADYRDVKFYTGSLAVKHFWKNQRNRIEDYLETLLGDILEEVNFGQKGRYFIHREYLDDIDEISQPQDSEPIKILTPFDNILRERHYPLVMWDFDYKIECYVPASDRVYGYFVLPILDQNELRGRVDAKVHRNKGMLELKSIFLESKELQNSEGMDRFVRGVWDFARFHQCDSVKVGKVFPRTKKTKLANLFDS